MKTYSELLEENYWLRETLSTVRLYPDFDNGEGPLVEMMDQALAGERPKMLEFFDSLDCYTLPEISPSVYWDGICAGHRTEHYENFTGYCPECPYDKDTPEADVWWKGFGDGTGDFISWQLSD